MQALTFVAGFWSLGLDLNFLGNFRYLKLKILPLTMLKFLGLRLPSTSFQLVILWFLHKQRDSLQRKTVLVSVVKGQRGSGVISVLTFPFYITT